MRLKPLVVIIDDDLLFRKALETVLPRLGFDVYATSEPETFLEMAKNHKADLCLIDLQLGETSGFELIERFRARDHETTVIVISGDQGRESVVNALDLGANDFILKPLDRVYLASKLSRYFDTDQLKEHRADAVDPPEGRSPARMSLDLRITEIDELGVGLDSRHLIPKGTVLKLSADLFRGMGSPVTELLVTVATSSFDPSSGRYRLYVEFDEPPAALVDALRKYLSLGRPA